MIYKKKLQKKNQLYFVVWPKKCQVGNPALFTSYLSKMADTAGSMEDATSSKENPKPAMTGAERNRL